LRVLYSPDPAARGATIPLSTPLRIGRSEEAQLSLPSDPAVSRLHATIVQPPDGSALTIQDTSTNGTFVNGQRVTEAVLRPGDVVRIGDTMLLLRHPDERDGRGPAIPGLVGDGPGMGTLRRTIARVAPSDATVLIIGETGTGKEVVARATYTLSGCSGPFVAVNCAAIPGALAESQLFGHVAGAFTGASRDHEGYVRAANGGVLFLDEIGELALELQGKLLRFLDERASIPVGTTRPIRSEARVVAATNRELRQAVADGQFRGDLYARLAEITIRTAPLRERREDVLPLLLRALKAGEGKLSPDLAEALVLYDWPFNVRELLKVAKELGIRGEGDEALSYELVASRLHRMPAPAPPPDPPSTTPSSVARQEVPIPGRSELEEMLREHHGVIADVARAAGRSRRQVQRWIERHQLDIAAFRDDGDSKK
jgi:DNA-binding NtrC family response regulator